MNKISLPFERFTLDLLYDAVSANHNKLLFSDMCGLFYCQKGEAKVSMNGCTLCIKPGDLYIYLPSSYVYIMSTSPDLDGVSYKTTVEFALEMLENIPFTKSLLALKDNPCVSLTPLQRDLLQAVYFENVSQAEIAARRGVSRSTVSRTLRRAELRLRRFLRY